MPSVNGEENKLAEALTDKPLNKSTVEDLKQVLRWVFVKVGLRAQNLPVDEEKAVLIEHIITHYGNHTPKEIRLAFDMAITYKLDLPEKEIPCYENFTCAYFSKIMNAYRVFAKETIKSLKPKVMIEEKKELEPVEMTEWIEEWKQKDDIVIDLIPVSFYDFLTSKEQIIVTPSDKWAYANKAAAQIKVQLQTKISELNSYKNSTIQAYKDLAEFEKMEKEGFTGLLKDRITNRAKKLIVYNYLKPNVSTIN